MRTLSSYKRFDLSNTSALWYGRLTTEYLKELDALITIIEQMARDKGWSMQQLAEEAGLARTSVHYLFAGERVFPQLLTLSKLCRAVGLEISYTSGKYRLKSAA